MKRKGFTLIELLTVIIILAVIALIIIPIIGNIIEDSKKKALETSVNGIVEAANYFAISNDGVYEFAFDESKKGETETGKRLNYKGQIEVEGKLYIDNEKNISFCFTNEDYYAYKNYNSGIYVGNISDDTCIIGYDALTNKYIAMLDDGSGTVSNVYSKEQVDSKIAELNTTLNNYALKSDLETFNTVTNTNISNLQKELDELKNSNSNTIDWLGTDPISGKVYTVNAFLDEAFAYFHPDILNIITKWPSGTWSNNLSSFAISTNITSYYNNGNGSYTYTKNAYSPYIDVTNYKTFSIYGTFTGTSHGGTGYGSYSIYLEKINTGEKVTMTLNHDNDISSLTGEYRISFAITALYGTGNLVINSAQMSS